MTEGLGVAVRGTARVLSEPSIYDGRALQQLLVSRGACMYIRTCCCCVAFIVVAANECRRLPDKTNKSTATQEQHPRPHPTPPSPSFVEG